MIFRQLLIIQHILNLNIDEALKKGDISIVEKIANFTDSKGKHRFLYSFASKYCFQHNREKYVIFDSYVQKSLLYFNEKYNFCSFKLSQESLKDYSNLVKSINEIRAFYGFDTFSNRQIDHMLWVYGRENFK